MGSATASSTTSHPDGRGRCAGPRSAAPPPPTTRSARPDRPGGCARARPGAAARRPRPAPSATGWTRARRTGRLTKTAGVGSQRAQRAMQAARRDDDEPVDLPGQGLRRAHLFVRVLTGVHQEHLQIVLPGRPLDRPHQGREVRVGDVGDDHRDVARPPGDQTAGGTVRNEPELPMAASTRRRVSGATFSGTLMVRDTVAACTPARAATSRIVARCSRRTHARPYTAARPSPRGRMSGRDGSGSSAQHAVPRACRGHCRTTTAPATPCIAHLGLGAFARAHLAVYADELLRRGRPALIRGVSLRSRRAQDQLEPQDGLFTVAVREPGEDIVAAGDRCADLRRDRAGRRARRAWRRRPPSS